jgi:hypothetical protein
MVARNIEKVLAFIVSTFGPVILRERCVFSATTLAETRDIAPYMFLFPLPKKHLFGFLGSGPMSKDVSFSHGCNLFASTTTISHDCFLLGNSISGQAMPVKLDHGG